MSEKERNERLLRAGIEAYNRGDVEAMVALFDPEIELPCRSRPGNPGTWHGLDGFREMVSGVAATRSQRTAARCSASRWSATAT